MIGINKVAKKLPNINDHLDNRLILQSEQEKRFKLAKDPQCMELDEPQVAADLTYEQIQRNVLRNHLRTHSVLTVKAQREVEEATRSTSLVNLKLPDKYDPKKEEVISRY